MSAEQKWFNAYQIAEAECNDLRRKLAIAAKALTEIYEWYDRDGSVGGADNVFEDNRDVLAAMRAVKGGE